MTFTRSVSSMEGNDLWYSFETALKHRHNSLPEKRKKTICKAPTRWDDQEVVIPEKKNQIKSDFWKIFVRWSRPSACCFTMNHKNISKSCMIWLFLGSTEQSTWLGVAIIAARNTCRLLNVIISIWQFVSPCSKPPDTRWLMGSI